MNGLGRPLRKGYRRVIMCLFRAYNALPHCLTPRSLKVRLQGSDDRQILKTMRLSMTRLEKVDLGVSTRVPVMRKNMETSRLVGVPAIPR